MKKYLIIIVPMLMLSTIALVAACPSHSTVENELQQAKKPAQIKFEKEYHDFGTFSRKDTAQVTVIFTYTNTGEQPLIIQAARTSCGCTKAAFSPEPVMPGKQGQISVTYNGNEVSPGYFKKSIDITSNGSEEPVTLYIWGTMEE